MKKLLLSLAVLICGSGTTQAALLFSGDFTAGTGVIEITAPINFEITANSFVNSVILDEVVTYDFSRTDDSFGVDLQYRILGQSPATTASTTFYDNWGATTGNGITPNDGRFSFNAIAVSSGQIFELLPQTLTNVGGSGFNPQYNSLGTVAAGDLFLVNGGGNIVSSNGTTVPEPSSLALLGLSSLGLAYRRLRRNKISHEQA